MSSAQYRKWDKLDREMAEDEAREVGRDHFAEGSLARGESLHPNGGGVPMEKNDRKKKFPNAPQTLRADRGPLGGFISVI